MKLSTLSRCSSDILVLVATHYKRARPLGVGFESWLITYKKGTALCISAWTYTRKALPDRSRTILFDELLDYFLEVWIPCAKAPREPVSSALGNFFASCYHVELARLARRTDNFNV